MGLLSVRFRLGAYTGCGGDSKGGLFTALAAPSGLPPRKKMQWEKIIAGGWTRPTWPWGSPPVIPCIPPALQPPHQKETKKSWRGLTDLSTEDTSFGLITPFCPVTNILKTYKKKTTSYIHRTRNGMYKTSTEAPRNTYMDSIGSRNRKDTELHQTTSAHVCGSRRDWLRHTDN